MTVVVVAILLTFVLNAGLSVWIGSQDTAAETINRLREKIERLAIQGASCKAMVERLNEDVQDIKDYLRRFTQEFPAEPDTPPERYMGRRPIAPHGG